MLFNRNLNVLGNVEHARLEELPLERFNVEEIPLEGEIVEEHAGLSLIHISYTSRTSTGSNTSAASASGYGSCSKDFIRMETCSISIPR